MSQNIVDSMTQGMTPAEWQRLLAAFPMKNPKVTDDIAKIQREAGRQDVIQWMRSNFQCPL